MPITNQVTNLRNTPGMLADTLANQPAAGFAGQLFVRTDSPYGIYRDTGSAWVLVASGSGGSTPTLQNVTTAGSVTTTTITAASFITTGGTSAQFTKGDGSLDSTVYLPKANPAYTGSLTTGTQTFTPSNALISIQSSVNSYNQVVLTNTSSGASASSDFIVGNNNSTDTTYYGDFGMNSSGFVGTGNFNTANIVYLYSYSADLSIGTFTSNAIHFIVNNGSADALTINTSGQLYTPNQITALKYIVSGGVSTQFLKGDGSLDSTTYLTAGSAVSTFSAGSTGFTPNTPTSGAIVLSGTLNVANGGTGVTTLASLASNAAFSSLYQGLNTNLTSLSGLTYASLSFVKMSAAGTFSLDTNTYLTAGSAVSTFSAGSTGFTPNTPTSGAIVLSGTLNVANGGTGVTTLASLASNSAFSSLYQGLNTNLTSISGLTYASLSFVKMSAAGTFILDTSVYITAASVASTYVPYSGATGSVTLGSNSFTAGAINGTTGTFSGNISLNDNYSNIKTISNGYYGGAVQLTANNSSSNRYSRIGLIDASSNWLGGMTIDNSLAATFSSSVTGGAASFTTGAFSSQLALGPLSGTPTSNVFIKNYSSSGSYAQFLMNTSASNNNAIGHDASGNFAFGITTGTAVNQALSSIWLTLNNSTGAAFLNSSASVVQTLNSTNSNGPVLQFNTSGTPELYVGKSNATGGGSGYYDFYAAGSLGERFFTNNTLALTIAANQAATFASRVNVNGATDNAAYALNTSGVVQAITTSVYSLNTTYFTEILTNSLTGSGSITNSSEVTMSSGLDAFAITTSGTNTLITATLVAATISRMYVNGTGGSWTRVAAWSGNIEIGGGTSITDAACLYTGVPYQQTGQSAYSGTITNFYGLLIEDISSNTNIGSKITNKYGIYQRGASDINFFNGAIQLGTGNALTSSVLSTVTNKIKIIVNGTTLYLLASTSSA